jgi:hypothetical protein
MVDGVAWAQFAVAAHLSCRWAKARRLGRKFMFICETQPCIKRARLAPNAPGAGSRTTLAPYDSMDVCRARSMTYLGREHVDQHQSVFFILWWYGSLVLTRPRKARIEILVPCKNASSRIASYRSNM